MGPDAAERNPSNVRLPFAAWDGVIAATPIGAPRRCFALLIVTYPNMHLVSNWLRGPLIIACLVIICPGSGPAVDTDEGSSPSAPMPQQSLSQKADGIAGAVERVAQAVEAARNQFESVSANGVKTIRTRVVSGKDTGSASRGQASNSDARYPLEFLARDFGLYKRTIAVPDEGASDGYQGAVRSSKSPNHELDAGDLSQGYIRPADTKDDGLGDFYGAFWIPGKDLRGMKPTQESVSAWAISQPSPERSRLTGTWDALQITLDFHSSTHLPLQYEVKQDGVVYDHYEWKWDQTSSGSSYPSDVRIERRITYPDGAVELQTDRLEFTQVDRPEKVSDAEFGFAALGLKSGTTVYDMRDPAQPMYEFQPTSDAADGLVKIAPVASAAPSRPAGPGSRTRWIILFNLVLLVMFLGGALLRKKLAR